MLLAVIGSVILHILAWALIILNHPASSPIREVSLVAIVLSFSIATFQFASNERYANSILSYLHDKYSPGIERVLLIVLGVASILKISAIAMGYPPNVGMVLLVFVIIGGVLHFFASQWQFKLSKRSAYLLIMVFTLGMIPSLGPVISYEVRAIIASLFYLALAGITLMQSDNNSAQKMSLLSLMLFYVAFFFNSWQLLPDNMNAVIFNPIVLLILVSFLILNWNARIQKILFLTVIAHYLLEYPVELGFSF